MHATDRHCTQRAMRNVRNAATTIPNVPHTSFRNKDFSGAIRKYETRIDILTKLEARTKNVCPAIDAYVTLARVF